MSKVLASFCSCGSVHTFTCPIPIIHEIKQLVCDARGIASYIPEHVTKEIDQLVTEEVQIRVTVEREMRTRVATRLKEAK